MSSMIEIGRGREFQNNTMKEIMAEGHEILIAKVNDKYYAANNRFPHMGGKLSHGNLEGTIITCPRHGSQFELKDGSVVRWLKGSSLISMLGKALKSPRPLTKYNVKVTDDKILVEA
ncbi:MAG: Rieske 2Fe-2S domain-containing protein [Dehalococcoidales bacterium]|nr:Rieske 2Fe-2S domain-containing protein [Dehalococcoidales bacterium]